MTYKYTEEREKKKKNIPHFELEASLLIDYIYYLQFLFFQFHNNVFG